MRRACSLALVALALIAACSKQPPAQQPVVQAPAAATADVAAALVQKIEMVDIPVGRFWMGTDGESGFQNGYPRHEVTIGAFRMGKYEVTFDQYDAFARATGRALPADEGWGRGDRPVIHVNWNDIHAFIDWLNQGGRRFRLPSEAEWEYAARGGTTTLYWWGDEPDASHANASANTGADQWEFTAPVGRFPVNPFGLHDVLGNVWEIVADCRHPTYDGAPTDGRAWIDSDCDSRVVRGGYYGSIQRGMQVAARAAAGEHFDSMGLGFRLAEDLSTGP
jgi:formylglycine-generating enzyme required for sulfatase activity